MGFQCPFCPNFVAVEELAPHFEFEHPELELAGAELHVGHSPWELCPSGLMVPSSPVFN